MKTGYNCGQGVDKASRDAITALVLVPSAAQPPTGSPHRITNHQLFQKQASKTRQCRANRYPRAGLPRCAKTSRAADRRSAISGPAMPGICRRAALLYFQHRRPPAAAASLWFAPKVWVYKFRATYPPMEGGREGRSPYQLRADNKGLIIRRIDCGGGEVQARSQRRPGL